MDGQLTPEPVGPSTVVEVVVRSSDLGSDQYVRGEVYFSYFEQSRLAHLRRLGIVPTFPPPPDAPSYFVIVETAANYRSSARFGDVLLVSTTTRSLSNRSFTLGFRIVRSTDPTVIVEGHSVQVWLDGTRNPAPIPPVWREELEASIV